MLIGKLCRPRLRSRRRRHRRHHRYRREVAYGGLKFSSQGFQLLYAEMQHGTVGCRQVGFRADDEEVQRRFEYWRAATSLVAAQLVVYCSALVAVALITLLIPPGGERNNAGKIHSKIGFALNVRLPSPRSLSERRNDARRQNLPHPARALCVSSHCRKCRRS